MYTVPSMAKAIKLRHAFGASCSANHNRASSLGRIGHRINDSDALWTIILYRCHLQLYREERGRTLGGPLKEERQVSGTGPSGPGPLFMSGALRAGYRATATLSTVTQALHREIIKAPRVER
jgi:hypothetical protein